MWHKLRVFAAAVLLGVLPNLAHAGIDVYTSRAAWTAALPAPVNVTMNFNMFTEDVSFAVTPANVGPFTLSAYNAASVPELLDAFPFMSPGDGNIDGTTYALIYVEEAEDITVKLKFDGFVYAFGADFQYPGNGTQLIMELMCESGAQQVLVPGTGSTLEFCGFISTEPFCSIRFRNSVNDGFGLDNVEAVRVGSLAVEHSTWGKVKALYR